jgi:hypothetical protein
MVLIRFQQTLIGMQHPFVGSEQQSEQQKTEN